MSDFEIGLLWLCVAMVLCGLTDPRLRAREKRTLTEILIVCALVGFSAFAFSGMRP